jgi:hypothetical protein
MGAVGAVSYQRVEHWFLGRVPIDSMVLNRLVLGGVILFHAASRLPEFNILYGSRGGAWSVAYRELVSTTVASDLAPAALWLSTGLAALGPDLRQAMLLGLYGLLLGSALAFMIGFRMRIAGIIAIALHLVFLAIHPLAHYGWASMVAPFTLYVVLSRAGEYASLDAWRGRRRKRASGTDDLAPAWPMRLLQVHVAAMYFHTGIARIDDPDWLRGEVLFEALTRTLFSRFTLDLESFMPGFVLLSYAVFLLEPLAAILLWIPRARTLCALALIAMHVCLEILTNVGWWNFIMIGGLLTFLPPPWIARLLPARG